MNAHKKDWKFTQYALGEMDAKEKAKFEASLSADADAHEEIEAIRSFSSLLSTELKKEPSQELTAQQHAALARKWAAEPRSPRRWGLGWRISFGLTPVAAALVALLSIRVLKQELPPYVGMPGAAKKMVGANETVDVIESQATQTGLDEMDGSGNELSKFVSAEPENSDPALKRPTAVYPSAPSGNVAASSQGAPPSTRGFIGQGGGSPSKPAAKADRRASRSKSVPMEEKAFNTESYDHIADNPFRKVVDEPLSTFSSDVDTASYANLRRFLTQGSLPPKDAVRIEEMINYFPYRYASPTDDKPFSVHVEVNAAPWAPDHRLVRIGLKGKEILWDKRAPSNLVFLIDVSGSMEEPNKLPLVKSALKLLVDKMSENDRISLVVYAGNSGTVLPPTPGNEKEKILKALDNLSAGGSTNGAGGIELAYKTAAENFRKGGINRVILATDGDFNVGPSSHGELVRIIEEKAKTGVFLTVLGFGMGNLKDSTMEKLADKGNGNYAYIDTLNEARKVFVQEIGGTLQTIAKDVKLQVEFNPSQVDSFRLIGYENRILAHEDFNNDKKDAGDIGAGHTVTALYEIVPAGKGAGGPGVDVLKYQKTKEPTAAAGSREMMTLKLRYKAPEASESKLVSYPVTDDGKKLPEASTDYKFAAAVASFGMILRDSPHKGQSSFAQVLDLATTNRGEDVGGYRSEFLRLVEKAKVLKKEK